MKTILVLIFILLSFPVFADELDDLKQVAIDVVMLNAYTG
jgi:hypothetical protein